MAGEEGFEPSKCVVQSHVPYRLATPQSSKFNARYLQLPLRLISTTWDLTCLIELYFLIAHQTGSLTLPPVHSCLI